MSPPTCTRCGALITADSRFCGQCGAVVTRSDPPAPPSPAPTSVAETDLSRVASPRRGFPTLPLVILAVGVLAVAAALLLVPRREPPAGEALLGSGGATPAPVEDGWLPSPTQPPIDMTAPTEVPPPVRPDASSDVPTPAPELVSTEPPPPTPTPTPPLVAVFEARRAARFDVSPDDAEITVNGRHIGKADDWDDMGGGKLYEFDGPGSYYVRLSLDGYRTAWIKIVVSPDAGEKIAGVDTELKKGDGRDDEKADKKASKAKKDKKTKKDKKDDEDKKAKKDDEDEKEKDDEGR